MHATQRGVFSLKPSLNSQPLLQPSSLPLSLLHPPLLFLRCILYLQAFFPLSKPLCLSLENNSVSKISSPERPPDTSKSDELLLFYLSSHSSTAALRVLRGVYLWYGSTYYILLLIFLYSCDCQLPKLLAHTPKEFKFLQSRDCVFSNFILVEYIEHTQWLSKKTQLLGPCFKNVL